MIGEKIKEVLKQYTGEKIDFPEFYIRTDKSEYTILSQAIEEKELESALPEPCFGCIGKTIIAIRIDKDSGTIVILLEDFSAIVVYVNHYFDVDGPDVGRFIRWDSNYEKDEKNSSYLGIYLRGDEGKDQYDFRIIFDDKGKILEVNNVVWKQ